MRMVGSQNRLAPPAGSPCGIAADGSPPLTTPSANAPRES
jgi:hypothetical protein